MRRWRLPYMGHWPWLALDEALPYTFIHHQKKFVQLAPRYLKPFNELRNNARTYDKTALPALVRKLQRGNAAFAGFVSAFYGLHDQLTTKSFAERGIDFRELRPLDHYSLLAIRAEGCLRRELDSLGKLTDIKTGSQGLTTNIVRLNGTARRLTQGDWRFGAHEAAGGVNPASRSTG